MDQDGKSTNSGFNGEVPAQNKVPTRKRRPRKRKLQPTEWIAIFGGIIIPIIVTLIPLFANRLPASPTLDLTFTSTATTAFITDSPTATPTFTSTPTILPSPTATDTPTASLTPIVTIESTRTTSVFVRLVANRNTGRPPLNVRFDARDSYLLEPDGRQLSCRGGPCFYTWSIYSGGQQIGNSENNSIGTFEHSFGSNGTYTVTVFVCRGRDRIDCAGSGTQIVVSR